MVARLGQREQPPLHQGQQLLVVDLVRRVQQIRVHSGQRPGGVPEQLHPSGHRLRGEVRQEIVEPMVAGVVGQAGVGREQFVDDALGELDEFGSRL